MTLVEFPRSQNAILKNAGRGERLEYPPTTLQSTGQLGRERAELAEIYGVPTKALNQAVKRNIQRFPEDFMFRLTRDEAEALKRSQFVTGSQNYRDPHFSPFVLPSMAPLRLSKFVPRA